MNICVPKTCGEKDGFVLARLEAGSTYPAEFGHWHGYEPGSWATPKLARKQHRDTTSPWSGDDHFGTTAGGYILMRRTLEVSIPLALLAELYKNDLEGEFSL